jgi:pilus assembly protein Flp/PilA
MKLLLRFVAEEDAASLAEYGIIAALIAVGSIVAMSLIGTEVNNLFGGAVSALGSDVNGNSP